MGIRSCSTAVSALQANAGVWYRCKGFEANPHSSVDMHAGSNGGADHHLEGLQAPHNFLPQASQALPVVDYADGGVRQCHEFLRSDIETTQISSTPAPGTLSDLQPAFDTQACHWPPSWQASVLVVLSPSRNCRCHVCECCTASSGPQGSSCCRPSCL